MARAMAFNGGRAFCRDVTDRLEDRCGSHRMCCSGGPPAARGFILQLFPAYRRRSRGSGCRCRGGISHVPHYRRLTVSGRQHSIVVSSSYCQDARRGACLWSRYWPVQSGVSPFCAGVAARDMETGQCSQQPRADSRRARTPWAHHILVGACRVVQLSIQRSGCQSNAADP